MERFNFEKLNDMEVQKYPVYVSNKELCSFGKLGL
jgi:hypothetical protein